MKLHVEHLQDGATLYEWINKDFRLGISIEKDPKDSGWYYTNKNGECEQGELPEELLRLLSK